ncbi:MAG: universal stress protein [Desulfobacteraceae bacterium]|nr:universal stress protein [Desulfobacteraceae bacterium]
MPSSDRAKILVATDGSEHALRTLHYASSILDPERFNIVLYHVVTRVPESFIDLEQIPAYRYRLVDVDLWEKRQEHMVADFMERGRAILSEAGFASDAVTVKAEERKVGIARDVAAESRNGYVALLVGRKGQSDLKDFMVGSIANKLLELVSIPIWIVGGMLPARKILICLDSSEGSKLGAKHAKAILCGSRTCEIVLFHAMRSFGPLKRLVREVFSAEEDKGAADKMEQQMREAAKLLEPSFDVTMERLVASGFDPAKISRKIVTVSGNTANAIVEEAEKEGCDTIVVGRRGLGSVEEFVMGRVSNKVIQLAKDRTVWVVT